MTNEEKSAIKSACMLLLSHGFTLTGPSGATKGPASMKPVIAPPPAPAPEKTVDGRSAYVCGKCGVRGHNARTCTVGATQAAPKAQAPKVQAPAVSDFGSFGEEDLAETPAPRKPAPAKVQAKPAATPKAPPVSAPLASLGFDGFGEEDLAAPPVKAKPAAAKPASVKAAPPKAAKPKSAPVDAETLASDPELAELIGSF